MTQANSSFLEIPKNPILRKFFEIYELLSAYTDPVVWVLDQSVNTVLDVGCGQGYPMGLIKKTRKLTATGVDLFDDYLKEARKSKIYDKVVKSDVTQLKLGSKSYDACICLQVIEHLSKNEGYKVLRDMENIAKYQVIVATPNHFFEHPETDNNKLQRHKSHWSDQDFERLGYKIKHVGLEAFFGNTGFVHMGLPRFVNAMIFAFDKVLMPFYWFVPRFADYWIIAYKDLKK